MAYYRLQLAAALEGDTIAIQVARDAAALAVARNQDAPPLARVLAAVAGGAITVAHAELIIAARPEMQEAAQLLAITTGAQTGDIAIGNAAGRDIITVNVYVGSADSQS